MNHCPVNWCALIDAGVVRFVDIFACPLHRFFLADVGIASLRFCSTIGAVRAYYTRNVHFTTASHWSKWHYLVRRFPSSVEYGIPGLRDFVFLDLTCHSVMNLDWIDASLHPRLNCISQNDDTTSQHLVVTIVRLFDTNDFVAVARDLTLTIAHLITRVSLILLEGHNSMYHCSSLN